MTRHESHRLHSGLYAPEKASFKTNAFVSITGFVVFGAAAFYSVVTTLDQQQAYHCQQGWQRACEHLK